ncbi:hypothetical protein [Dactylosporangium sp. CA-139066]|uniref:hypothetical protein n=1 Tax=Dactylosporangium sp. CA-139066 TaxID=3239930 RepID=UPI003D929F84
MRRAFGLAGRVLMGIGVAGWVVCVTALVVTSVAFRGQFHYAVEGLRWSGWCCCAGVMCFWASRRRAGPPAADRRRRGPPRRERSGL